MKRGKAMARGTTPMVRAGRLRYRSKKMAAIYKGTAELEGRAELVERLLRERPVCEAGEDIGGFLTDRDGVVRTGVAPGDMVDGAWRWFWMRCGIQSRDVHEKLARSGGGSILDESNLLCVCRTCHDWIGDHPREALALGLRLSRYSARNIAASR